MGYHNPNNWYQNIESLDKECLIYKEMSNSNSTRSFGNEAFWERSPKVNPCGPASQVQSGQYRINQRIKSWTTWAHTIPTIGIRAVWRRSAKRPKYPSSRNRTHRVRIGRCVCGRDQVKRSWKSIVGQEMNVILSLRRRMWDNKLSPTLEN